MSSNNPSNQGNKNLDYPEPFDVGFARYVTDFDDLCIRVSSRTASPSPPPPPPAQNRPWDAPYLGGPQAPSTVPGPQPQPVCLQGPTQNRPPPPPPFQSGPYWGSTPYPFAAPVSFNRPSAHPSSSGSSYTGQLTPSQARRNALVPTNGSIGTATPEPQHNYHQNSFKNTRSSSTPVYSSYPTNTPTASTGRARTRQHHGIRLQPGFEWNKESLALLCIWKDVRKKGMRVVAESGDFPGHDEQSLARVWETRKTEARRAYDWGAERR
ncbi:hypothetical protein DE146DRAFT_634325 [Phaeosphaeria sp. MPI-PUGE-AT-0046c]|nr:hypothetical protein DE146DRAFT_634325 [Phaeosphaeria sp. MPI-PUGE-AT-0046c]